MSETGAAGPPRRELLGLWLHDTTLPEAVDLLDCWIADGAPHRIFQLNVTNFMDARRDAQLRRYYEDAELVTLDGRGLLYGAWILRQPFKEMVSGYLLMERLLERADHRGFRVFFLGGRQQALDMALKNVRRRFPRLVVAGCHHGYWSSDEEPQIVEQIVGCHPDILLVGMSTPLKERFISSHYYELGVPVCMGVGGSLDVLAGITRLSPPWMRALGLEWVYRILQEPRRLWKRYFRAIPAYLALVVGERLEQATRHSTRTESPLS